MLGTCQLQSKKLRHLYARGTHACRVLQPGGVFVEVSLGDPSQRLPLLCTAEFKWQVSVCLLPRAPLENMVKVPNR